MSPGPDFFLIVRQSLCEGRKICLLTSMGIGAGIIVHVLFCIFGLGVIISTSDITFNLLIIVGALYITYLGVSSLRTNAPFIPIDYNNNEGYHPYTAFSKGFFTNILNPKAILFFITVFTAVVDASTTRLLLGLYGLYMSITTFIWFTAISYIFSNQGLRDRYKQFIPFFEKGIGIVLIVIALGLIL